MRSFTAAMMSPFTIVGVVKVTLSNGSTDEALTMAERYAEGPKARTVHLLRLLSLLHRSSTVKDHKDWVRTKVAIGERLAANLGGRVSEWVFGGSLGQIDGAAGTNNGGNRTSRRRGRGQEEDHGDDEPQEDEVEGEEEDGEEEGEPEEADDGGESGEISVENIINNIGNFNVEGIMEQVIGGGINAGLNKMAQKIKI